MSLDERPSAAVRKTHAYRVTPGLAWSAILAGAVVSVALSLLLLLLGAGFGMQFAAFGLSSRASLAGFSREVGAYAVAAQVLPAALGGYLSGRLRHGWHGVHDDETHFRDTAQGLVTWAVATVAGALMIAGALGPYAQALAAVQPSTSPTAHAADISAQASYFAAVGLLLSAFASAVAARIGGLRVEEMHPVA